MKFAINTIAPAPITIDTTSATSMLEEMLATLPANPDEKRVAIEAYARKNCETKRQKHPCRTKHCHYGSWRIYNQQCRDTVLKKEEAHELEEAQRISSIDNIASKYDEMKTLNVFIPAAEAELNLAITQAKVLREYLIDTGREIEKREVIANSLCGLIELEGEHPEIITIAEINDTKLAELRVSAHESKKELKLLSEEIEELENKLPQLHARAEYLAQLLY